MRIKLTLSQKRSNQLIPINYQYPISCSIYRTLETSNSKYSKWLHEKGFMSGNKKFKMFTFSKLDIAESEMHNLYESTYLKIKSENVSFIVSMLSEATMENFIMGMFENQQVKIFNKHVESEFLIKSVELVPQPDFSDFMTFKTISPVVLTKKVTYKEKETYKYLAPEDEEYAYYFIKNLNAKLYVLAENLISIDFLRKQLETSDKFPELKFIFTGTSKQKLITIKEGSHDENKVKSFFYTFNLQGDPGLMKLGYEAGFGKNCSTGFGCVKLVSNVNRG